MNTATQTTPAPLGPCAGCEFDVAEDEVWAYRVETHSGQEFVAMWCPECREVAMPLDEDIKAIRDIRDEECSDADWQTFQWDDSRLVPERIVVTLRPDVEVNALAAFDVDYWWVKSAHDVVTGNLIDPTQSDLDVIRKALDARREREAGEF